MSGEYGMKFRIGLFLGLLAFLFVASTRLANAQSDRGSISGHVTDPSGAVLQGAQVELQPSGATFVTDAQGAYFFHNLKPGSYTVTITYLGFSQFTKAVNVTAGQPLAVDASMTVSSNKDQIIVTTERASGEAEALNRERTADNIVQVLPNEVFTSLPNANIADAVGRLPSVTLERDEGEGKYIQVRSLEPRLTNATVDGVNIPSPEAGVRQIKFDSVPADLVESVEVNKTLQANMDGDGIGGSVNLVTKTAGERPTVALNGAGGTTPIAGGRTLVQTSGTIGERFGSDKKWGALFGFSYDWNGRGIDDIEPVPDVGSTATGSQRYFDTQDIREYAYKRSRWGVSGSGDRVLNEGSNIYVRYLFSDFHDFGDKWVYTLTDNTTGISLLNANGCGTDTNGVTIPPCTGTPHFSTSNRVPIFIIGSLLVGGKHVFATSWLSWDVSASRSQQTHSGGDEGADFATNATYNNLYPNGSTCQYNPAGTKTYVPQWSPSCFTEAYSPANYDLQDINFSVGKSAQLNLQFTGAYGKRYHLGGHLATFEVGGKFRNAHKFDDSYTPTYTPNGSLPMTQFLGTFTNNNYYMNDYQYGPVTSWSTLSKFVNTHPQDFTLDPTTIGANPGNFDLIEKVSAGYVMNTFDFSKIRIVAGLRVEGTNLDTVGFDIAANTLSFQQNGSYVKLLPSASLRYDLGHDTDVRVVYSRALSRPDPQDIAQALSVTLNQTPLLASLGNPGLKAESANNYDLLVEHYLKPFGIIEGGFFYKQLYDPIVTQSLLQQNYTPAPGNAFYPVGTWLVTQPINAGSGWLYGFEINYLEHFTFLPGFWSGFGLSANYSFTDSQADGLPGRSDSPRLVRQAPHTFNVSPTYDRGRLSVRLGMTYNAASIFAYQYQDGTDGSTPTPGGLRGPNGDTYLFPHFQVDLQGSFRLKYGFTFMAYGLNLNNEVFGFYNGQKQYFIQREFYQPTVALGLRWSPSFEHK
jgi:TonB-dependent receptor